MTDYEEAESVTCIISDDQTQVTYLFPRGIKAFATAINAEVLCIENGELNFATNTSADWTLYPVQREESNEEDDGGEDGSHVVRFGSTKKKN